MSDLQSLASETLKALAEVSTGTLTTILIKDYGLRFRTVQDVRPLNPDRSKFVGEAYTLRFVPIREDLADIGSPASPSGPNRGLIDQLPAGVVVMIDARGEKTCGVLGDMLVTRMIALGVKGLVTDGGIRDGDILAGMSLEYVPVLWIATSLRSLRLSLGSGVTGGGKSSRRLV